MKAELTAMHEQLWQARKNAETRIDQFVSDLAQIYGLIEGGDYEKAQEYCRAAAENYTQDIAAIKEGK